MMISWMKITNTFGLMMMIRKMMKIFLIPRSFDGGDLALKVEKCGGFVTTSTHNIYFM